MYSYFHPNFMKLLKNLLIVATVFIFYTVNSFAQQNCCKEYYKEDFGSAFKAAYIDGDSVYVSTYYHGFYNITLNQVDTILFPDYPLPDLAINLIAPFQEKLGLTKNFGSILELFEFDKTLKTFVDKKISTRIIPNSQTTDYGHCFDFDMKEKNNKLYIGTSSGILIYDTLNNLVQIQDFNDDDTIDFVYDIDVRSDETICLCTNSGVYNLTYDNLKIEKITSKKCKHLVSTEATTYFITGDPLDGSIYKIENNMVSVESTPIQEFGLKYVRDMIVNYDQSLLFITLFKIFSYKDQVYKPVKDIQEGEKLYVSDSKIVYLTSSILYVCDIDCLNPTNNPLESNLNFSLYPTVTVDKIHIKIAEDIKLQNFQLIFSDPNGKPVYSQEVSEHDFDIEIQNLPSGKYVVSLTGNGQIIHFPFVKVTP